MEIIAHRGVWQQPHEKNSIKAFEEALSSGFGIETDIRDSNQDLVISHDIPDEHAATFSQFLKLVNEINSQVTLALNIKADGLEKKLQEYVSLQKIPHFYFDMSIPDTLSYVRENLSYYTRFSDIEETPALYSEATGVWLDSFYSNKLNEKMLLEFLQDNKLVALVSPELHGFEHSDYWTTLKTFINHNSNFKAKIKLCTDHPHEAKRFFCE
ncbi:hypothetical protein [Vibrio salinus]|uniref:hypothetical protein n=1 Tax=Vibrio salinus TaxID=2899784 RepID=UPI001E4E704A|nr:hypothetical protein [Vibrio salinus]MCE0493774.1 hypothetical protein [Vibrio salinus]